MMTCVYSACCGDDEFASEQLRGAAYAAQRVLDLVREIAYQVAVGLLLFQLPLLAGDLDLLVDLPEFEQQRASLGSSGVTVQLKCSRRLPLIDSSISCSV